MSSITEITLGNGWEVQARPVPPHATYVWQQIHIPTPNKPSRPMVELVSEVTGHTEIVPALPDSDEWDAWVEQIKVWNDAVQEIRIKTRTNEMAFSLDYSIIAFKHQGLYPDNGWMKEPPDDWSAPDVYIEQCTQDGVDTQTQNSRRMQFINLELLERSIFIDEVSRIAFPMGDADTSPVREEEIRAVLEKFRAGDGVSNPSGSVDNDTRTEDRTREDESVLTRDVDSSRDGFFRRLVQLVKGS